MNIKNKALTFLYLVLILPFLLVSCSSNNQFDVVKSSDENQLESIDKAISKKNNEPEMSSIKNLQEENHPEEPLGLTDIEIDNLNGSPKYFIDISEKDKEFLIAVAYQAVEDYFYLETGPDQSLFKKKFDQLDYEVYTVLRIKGRRLATGVSRSINLAESVYLAVKDAVNQIEDTIEINSLRVEIIIAGEEIPIDESFEKGIHGIKIIEEDRIAVKLNTVAIEGNLSKKSILKNLCAELGYDSDCYLDENVKVYYFPTLHFANTDYSEEIITFYRCSATEFIPDITKEKIINSLNLAEGWMILNLDEDGYFNYGYSPSNGEYLNKNNMIRQLLSSKWLAHKSQNDEVLKYMHKINLDYILRNWYKENEESGYIYFGNKSKLGAMALALSTLAKSPFLNDYKKEAMSLANTIIDLQNKDGSFRAWYIEPDYSFDEERLLRFYSGEAILSLVEFYEATGIEQYLEAAIKSQNYYITEYVDHMDENYYPAYIPWHSICLNKLYKIKKDERYKEALFILNDEVIKIQNLDGKPYIDFLGRFYDPEHPEYGPPNSGSTAPYIEGLAYAYEIAEIVNDQQRMETYKKSIILGTHNLINLQFQGPDMYYLGHPERVEGALRYRMYDNRIRIDTTQHTIDAFLKILEVFYPEF